jgi:hypothetical protein
MKFYDVGNRDIVDQDLRHGGAYMRHVQALTAEALHSKSDIAAELAHRDIVISSLRQWVRAALECKTWVWDSDQRLAAMGCVIEADQVVPTQASGGSVDEG